MTHQDGDKPRRYKGWKEFRSKLNKDISKLENELNNTVQIGFKSNDPLLFGILKDIINKNKYLEITKEKITYDNYEPNLSLEEIYTKFSEDKYNQIRQKARKLESEIVMLYPNQQTVRLNVKTTYIGKTLDIHAYYYKEK